jgi:hypothetical protein
VCEFLVQASSIFYGGLFLGGFVTAIPILLFVLGRGYLVPGAKFFFGGGLAILFASLALDIAADDGAEVVCENPTAGRYHYNFAIGDPRSAVSLRLDEIVVTKTDVKFLIHYHNSSSMTQRLVCPGATALNGRPSVEFSAGKPPGELGATDFYCNSRVGETIKLQPDEAHESWATFDTDWRFGHRFTLWWYGNVLTNLELPS